MLKYSFISTNFVSYCALIGSVFFYPPRLSTSYEDFCISYKETQKIGSFWFKPTIPHKLFTFCLFILSYCSKYFGVGFIHFGGHDGVEVYLCGSYGVVSQAATDDGYVCIHVSCHRCP